MTELAINTIRMLSMVGMKTFGAPAPLKELQREFGFEPDQVITVAKDLLPRNQRTSASAPA
jgi:transketolase